MDTRIRAVTLIVLILVLLSMYISKGLYNDAQIDSNYKQRLPGLHYIQSLDLLAGSTDWKPRYTQLRNGNGNILLYGASIRNISNGLKEIAIYGQWHKSLKYDESITRCCVRYGENKIVELPITRHIYRPPKKGRDSYILQSFIFVCSLPIIYEANDQYALLPTHASFKFDDLQCTEKNHSFIPTFMALKTKPMTIGVTPKVAWGSLNSNSLIEWFEAVLYLGVDRIIVYVDDTLNDDARRVVNYYKDKGLCEAIPYSLPDIHPSHKELYPRIYNFITEQICHDFQMIMYDSLERLRGMTYYFLLDSDEFLIPSGNRSYKQMLNDFEQKFNQNNKYNGYFFMTSTFPLNWNKNSSLSDLTIGQYHYRAAEGYIMEPYHKKSMLLPEAVDHYFGGETPFMNNGYKQRKMLDINYTEGYTRHYRAKEKYSKNKMKKILDLEMVDWGNSHIAARVRNVRESIFSKT